MAKKGWTKEELCRDLRESCGIKAGDIVIMHSSMKEIGRVEGGTKTTVEALKTVITEEGTLLMPALSSPPPDGVFYMVKTPSRVGLVTEVFRISSGVKRSMHPTHSVAAWGKRADELLAGHEKTTPVGVDNPFHKAAQAGADMLMVGCDLKTCTLVHTAEAIVRTPYLGRVAYPGYDRALTLVDYQGKRHAFPPRDLPGDGTGFYVVQEVLESRGLIRHCRLGSAETLKFSAMACLDIAVELLRADPAALLCNHPRCPVCPRSRQIIEEARQTRPGDLERS